MSDQSLRDALEKLCDRYDRIAEEVSVRGGVKASYDIPGSEIRYLLAAHPAEPVGVSEPLDTRAYLREKYREELDEWWAEQVAEHDAAAFSRGAAAEHQMGHVGIPLEGCTACQSRRVGVSDEAVEATYAEIEQIMSDPDLGPSAKIDAINELLYSDEAEGDRLAALEAAAPMMGATPRPTRDQVAAIWREHTWISDESRCSCGDREIEFMSHHVADAVLALMGGAG